jgi:hypothetical protein
MEIFVDSTLRRNAMPYYDPAGSYVLCSFVYLVILTLASFTAAHIFTGRFSKAGERQWGDKHPGEIE